MYRTSIGPQDHYRAQNARGLSPLLGELGTPHLIPTGPLLHQDSHPSRREDFNKEEKKEDEKKEKSKKSEKKDEKVKSSKSKKGKQDEKKDQSRRHLRPALPQRKVVPMAAPQPDAGAQPAGSTPAAGSALTGSKRPIPPPLKPKKIEKPTKTVSGITASKKRSPQPLGKDRVRRSSSGSGTTSARTTPGTGSTLTASKDPTPPPLKRDKSEKPTVPDLKPEDSDEEGSEQSEPIELWDTIENAEAINETTLAKLSRLGMRRHIWTGEEASYCVILAFLAGFDSMTTFASNIDKYGTSFIVVYFILLASVGFPCFYLEMALGQFTSSDAYHVFKRMAPAMTGLGLVSLVLNFLLLITDHMIVTYFMNLISYTINFFTNAMPWHNCVSGYNDPNCRELYHTCDHLQTDYKDLEAATVDKVGLKYLPVGNICYRSRLALSQIDGVEDEWHLEDIDKVPFEQWLSGEALGQHLFWQLKITDKEVKHWTWPTHEFLLYTFLIWLTVFAICAATGRRFMSNLSRLTVFFIPATIISFGVLILHIQRLEFPFLHGAQSDPKSLFEDANTFFSMFTSAMVLVVVTLRLGQGSIIYFGSQNAFRTQLLLKSAILVGFASLIPLAYAICHLLSVDSYILYLVSGDMERWTAAQSKMQAVKFYASGLTITNVVFFLQSLRTLKEYEPLMILFFSTMGLLINLVNKIIRVEMLVSAIVESFPEFADRTGRRMVIHLVVCVSLLACLFFVSEDGMYLLMGLETEAVPRVALVVLFCEMMGVSWCYGGKRMTADITAMSNRRNQEQESRKVVTFFMLVTRAMWAIVIPGIIGAAIVEIVVSGIKKGEIQLSDPSLLLTIALIGSIGAIAGYKVLSQYVTSKSVKQAFRPDPELWGPRTAEDRIHAERQEKKLRAH